MSRLIEHLRSLDRKERFAVLRDALGFHPEAPRLDEGFREKLATCIGRPVPAYAFLAMDYHLDWIRLALYLAENLHIQPETPFSIRRFDDFSENQEDVDLLAAFEANDDSRWVTHLVLIEAKYLPWSNPQLKSKATRLGGIFGATGNGHTAVSPHYVLMTGRRSDKIRTECWPEWAKKGEEPFWLEYELPRRLEANRCSPDGRRSIKGNHNPRGLHTVLNPLLENCSAW